MKKKMEIPEKLDTVKIPARPGISIGIEETLDCVDFAVAFANSAIAAYSDGSLGFSDIQYLLKPISKLPAMLTNITHVPYELNDVSEAERDEIIAAVRRELDTDDEAAVKIIEKSLAAVYSLYELIKAVKNAAERK